jgi:hypothetical protein
LDRWIDFASYLPSHIMIIEQQRLGVHHPLLGGYEVPPSSKKGVRCHWLKTPLIKG